jgi:hypothetical protein
MGRFAVAKNQDKIAKGIGKLIKEAHKLEDAEQSLEQQRMEKLDAINKEFLPKIQAKHREIEANKFAIEKLKLSGLGETDDEEIARGKALLRDNRNLNVGSGQLQNMQAILAEIGIFNDGSQTPESFVGLGCEWCTAGCKSSCTGGCAGTCKDTCGGSCKNTCQDSSRANPNPPQCKSCYGSCAGSCIGSCKTACGSSCWGTCYGGPAGI